ncbi:hypothetical protein BCT97_019460 [Vibrio breoganii]|uniref:hypothetical protein n=1 Tax=Vibrio breoganii TaxID=553239 RepID=UPI0039AFB56A
MKLTQIGIIVGAIIGFNAANADPLPTSAPEPGPGVKEGTIDLGIAGKVAAIEPLAMDNTAVWQMGNGDQANVLINQKIHQVKRRTKNAKAFHDKCEN